MNDDARPKSRTDRVLSDFGKRRLRDFSKQRAEIVDENTSTIRHYAKLLLELVLLGSWLGAIVSLILLIASPFIATPPLEAAKPLAMNIVVGYMASVLADRVANPTEAELL